MHTCYCLYWTGFVYVSNKEALGGWLQGMAISILSYDLDFLVDIVLKIVEPVIMKIIDKLGL